MDDDQLVQRRTGGENKQVQSFIGVYLARDACGEDKVGGVDGRKVGAVGGKQSQAKVCPKGTGID